MLVSFAHRPVPVKKGKTLEAPGSVSGDVELEQLLTSLVLLSFSKLVVDQAFACIPSPVERPGIDADLSNLPSLPSPLRLHRADFALKDSIMLPIPLRAFFAPVSLSFFRYPRAPGTSTDGQSCAIFPL